MIKEKFKLIFGRLEHRPSHQPNWNARLSENIASKLAFVACEVDGEDTAGRQKVRLLTPQEITSRANDIAECMITDWEKRGWLVEVEQGQKED